MKILVISHYYAPEPIPKPSELAEALRARGHAVTALTGLPNYPSGKLADGYKLGLVQRENLGGVPVTRTFEYPYHGKNKFLRAVNYLSFMFSAPLGVWSGTYDVIYVWHPPLTVGIAAWVIARLKGVPFVYDVQDIWPDFVVLSGLVRAESPAVAVMKLMERFIYRRAAHLIVGTEAAKENLIGKRVPAAKISVLPNWIDETLFTSDGEQAELCTDVRREYGWKTDFTVVFAGNLGLVQGLDTVLRAAQHLDPNDNVRFVLIGDGVDKPRLEAMANTLNVTDRVQFIERQPMEKIPAFLGAADALLVHLKHSEMSRYVIPSKTVAYLATGKPILMAMNGAAAQLIENAGAGVVVEPDNPVELAAAIRRLKQLPAAEREQMGRNGREHLLVHLKKQNVVTDYEELLRRVAAVSEAGEEETDFASTRNV